MSDAERAARVLHARQFSHLVPVSREIAIEAGLIEPTPQERQAADAERRAAERRAAERKAKLDAARRRLTALTDPLARAILDLHAENDRGECDGDEFGGYDGLPPDWPCSTVEAVAARYGIELGRP